MKFEEIRNLDVLSNPFITGAAGAILGLKSMPGATWFERAVNLVIGLLASWFVTPPLAEWMHIPTISVICLLAFGVGAFCVAIYVAIIQAIAELDFVGPAQALIDKVAGREKE